MSHTIWKFKVEPHGRIVLPKDAKILSINVQQGEPHIWALVDPDEPKGERQFYIVATDEKFDSTDLDYLGSFHGVEGWMVFHLFEKQQEDV